MWSGRTLIQASSFSSLESADSTAAIEAGRPAASGTMVSGKSVVFCSGRTGISNGTPSGLVLAGGASEAGFVFSSAISSRMKPKKYSLVRCLFGACGSGLARRVLGFLMQSQDQKTVVIITRDRSVLDGTRKLNHLFKATVSNFELVMRDALAADAVASRATNAQYAPVNRDLDVFRSNAREVNFHDPTVTRAIDIGRRTPQASRRARFTRALDRPKVTLKRFAGHSYSVQKSIQGFQGKIEYLNYKTFARQCQAR